MIGLLQRVSWGYVDVNNRKVASINHGLLVLIGIQQGDSENQADRLLQRLLTYRVFEDAEGRMNRSVREVHGELLLVPQFTLAADTRKGNRPSFTPAANPDVGRRLFDHLVARARADFKATQSGVFGAHMQVGLLNDGPVTIWLEVTPPAPPSGA